MHTGSHSALRDVAALRWRVALVLSFVVALVYLVFIFMTAYARPWLASLIAPGLSVGIVLGVVVILLSWSLTWYYIWWANRHYDPVITGLRR